LLQRIAQLASESYGLRFLAALGGKPVTRGLWRIGALEQYRLAASFFDLNSICARRISSTKTPRNDVRRGDRGGATALHKAMQWTPASRKSNLASPVQFDNGGGIHVQDLVRCRHIRRFIPIHYRSPCRWYLVCALRHWLGRDELRFLLISAMPRYRVGSRWILPSQPILSLCCGKATATALSAQLLATPRRPICISPYRGAYSSHRVGDGDASRMFCQR